jgi:transcriptional regulator with XRE-family HTH domain
MFDKHYFPAPVLARSAGMAANLCMKRKRRRIEHEAGNFIGAWREHLGLTQEELAERAGTSTASISRLESGKVGYTKTMLENISLAMGVEPWQLLGQRPDIGTSLVQKLQHAAPEQIKQLEAVADALLQFTPPPPTAKS